MTYVRSWLLLVLGLIAGAAHCQPATFGSEWQFARYLADKEATDEALFVLQAFDKNTLTVPQRDSLAYLRGWLTYSAKSLDEAGEQLLAVSPASPFYLKAHYFGAYCLAFQNQRDSARAVMNRLPAPDSTLRELRAFEQAGLALLQRQYGRYDTLRQQFTYSSYALSAEETRLDAHRRALLAQKRRSPALAGLMSAVVPGSGKWYAGKARQGIASFLPVLMLGLLTWEGYRKDGPTSLRFLGFGSLFTVFYVGNVWGSTLAVKVRRDEFNRVYDNKILFDMHIPLRNLLNR
ncbi:tetratricopeptide repeat protein [Spirosoma utsteinense]|uniref:DUF5683 domain-containing protein n=1 Tax=Spirosoma utsteinense TaxID=2585773 RepID=A0ABR6W504_9BACT|nr:hypothetical protein [Spirosoma utsteinense]MBC3784746.1 hypothetical protein [Spirosoma utsteinense]MBC3791218.1 hypothetical protein [Spirosoma utsteinense]